MSSTMAKRSMDYFMVKVDDKLIEKQIVDLRRRYGKLESTDQVGETDMVMGLFRELDSKKAPKEEGIEHNSTISMEFLNDKKAIKALLGKKVDDAIVIDPKSVSKDAKDMVSMLGLKGEEELKGLSKQFKFTINEIKRMEMAELNEELYNKLFPTGEVKSEEDLNKKVADDLANMFKQDSDRLFTQNVYEYLLDKTKNQFCPKKQPIHHYLL